GMSRRVGAHRLENPPALLHPSNIVFEIDKVDTRDFAKPRDLIAPTGGLHIHHRIGAKGWANAIDPALLAQRLMVLPSLSRGICSREDHDFEALEKRTWRVLRLC